ncbi:MAG TPA: ABC transporter permease [Cyclobacteriaceae bacterium]
MSQRDPILPRSVQLLLRTFLRDDLLDEVTGDMHEMYKDTRRNHSRFVSNIITWYQVINYLRPFAIKKRSRHNINSLPMYKSYLITALRNMIRNKMHVALNILGLSVGITVTIIITLWITDEISHEKNFKNYQRIGQVIQNVTNNGEVQTWRNVPWPLSDEIRKNYHTDFQRIALITQFNWLPLKVDSIKFEKPGLFAEADFAKMLEPTMIYGSLNSVDDPRAILLSKSTALALFGDNDPVGKSLVLADSMDMHVGGVYDDIPVNSEFTDMQYIASWDRFFNDVPWMRQMDDPWRPNAFHMLVQLTDNATFEGASARIKDAKMKRISEALQKKKPELFLHPMSEWHLKSEFINGKQTGGRMTYVWLFGIVGVFVLLMACINFMNLSTARSEKRAKEVGIRKAVGSLRSQLVNQFLSESVITVFISLLVALLLSQLSLPFFNAISEKHMAMPWSNLTWWIVGLVFTVAIGIIAGSYPALYLSSMGLAHLAKNGRSSSLLRKALVTIQFTVSVVLIIGTAVVYLQIQHARNRPLGYNANGLIFVWMSREFHEHFDAINNELKASEAITEICEASAPPTGTNSSSSQFEWNGKDPNVSVDFLNFRVSSDYGKTIGWNVVKGRDFDKDRKADTATMIVNQAAADYMGLKDPVGETIRWAGQPFQLIGIIENMVITSPYANPVPIIYVADRTIQNVAIIKLNPKMPAEKSLGEIGTIYKKYNPERDFSYTFTDVDFSRKFGNEERIGTLASTLACLAIFISCLGIFGLSSFTAEQRTKEIGVRKVLGASIFNIWTMMSKDFVVLVIFSCVIAMPIAYLLLNDWLETFSYHMGVPVWTFIAATCVTLLITLFTVSWHTLSAAGSNPVKSLRVE